MTSSHLCVWQAVIVPRFLDVVTDKGQIFYGLTSVADPIEALGNK